MRNGLGRVYATGMYRYIGHVKFSKFQTGIFVQWKADIRELLGGESGLDLRQQSYSANVLTY